MGRGTYNPLAEGHVERAGTFQERALWKLTAAGLVEKETVELELKRIGYVIIQVGTDLFWTYEDKKSPDDEER
jgi:predicted transcriptional regulator